MCSLQKNSTFLRCLFLSLLCMGYGGCSKSSGNDFFGEPLKLGDGKEWRMYPVITDVDKDGNLDIVATHRRPLHENSFHIFRGAGDGNFSEIDQKWVSTGYAGVDAGDLNGDGKTDFVMGSHYNRIHTFLGNEPFGKFKETVLPSPDGYVNAKIVDINKNSIPDVVMLGNEKAGVEIFEFNELTGLSLKSRFLEGNIGRDFRVVDMNNDGRLDVVASMGRTGVSIILQDEKGQWNKAPETNFQSETKEFKTIDTADINNDGWTDIILNGGFAGLMAKNGPDVYLSKGKDGGWINSSTGLKVFKKPAEGVIAADINNDGNLDIIAGGNVTGKLDNKAYGFFLFFGDGKGGWTYDESSGLPKEGLPRPYGLAVADLNKDKNIDLVSIHGAPEEGDGFLGVWLSRGKK